MAVTIPLVTGLSSQEMRGYRYLFRRCRPSRSILASEPWGLIVLSGINRLLPMSLTSSHPVPTDDGYPNSPSHAVPRSSREGRNETADALVTDLNMASSIQYYIARILFLFFFLFLDSFLVIRAWMPDLDLNSEEGMVAVCRVRGKFHAWKNRTLPSARMFASAATSGLQ